MIPDKAFEIAAKGGYQSDIPWDFWQIHALNPLFFKALGKEQNWWFGWKQIAHRFYDLILEKKDPTPFWQEILAAKK